MYCGWNFLQYIDYRRIAVSWYYCYRGQNIVMVSYREVPGDTKPYHEPGAYSEPWTCVIQFGIVKAGLVSGKDI